MTGEGRQIVFQDFVSSDLSLKDAHARVNFAMKLADYQRAKYEIDDLRKDFEKAETALKQFLDDKTRVDGDIDRQIALLDVGIGQVSEMRAAKYESGYNAHTKTRQGEYRPLGATKADLDRLDQDMKNQAAQKAALEQERKVAKDNLDITIQRHKEGLERLRAQIEEREVVLAEAD